MARYIIMKVTEENILEIKTTNGLNYIYIPDIYQLVKHKENGKQVYQIEYVAPTDDGTDGYMEQLDITRQQYQELKAILDSENPF